MAVFTQVAELAEFLPLGDDGKLIPGLRLPLPAGLCCVLDFLDVHCVLHLATHESSQPGNVQTQTCDFPSL